MIKKLIILVLIGFSCISTEFTSIPDGEIVKSFHGKIYRFEQNHVEDLNNFPQFIIDEDVLVTSSVLFAAWALEPFLGFEAWPSNNRKKWIFFLYRLDDQTTKTGTVFIITVEDATARVFFSDLNLLD